MVFTFDSYDPAPAASFETITVSTVAIGCTAANLVSQTVKNAGDNSAFIDTRRADFALFSIETNSIRIRQDGTDPTAGVGHLFVAGDAFVVRGHQNLTKLRMIRASADASVSVTYFRRG